MSTTFDRINLSRLIVVAAAIAAGGNITFAIPPQANNPLPTPFFSIDLASPSIGGPNNIHADDVLQVPGPTPAVQNINMGLGRPGDELDSLSGAYPLTHSATFTLLFSVDRTSTGGAPPDPTIVTAGFPYNVQQQAALNQAAGDLFMATRLFNLGGPLPSPGRAIFNNTQVINQGDAGGVDFQLEPDISPVDPALDPIDDVKDAGYFPGGPFREPTSLFFSLNRSSPSLNFLPLGPNNGATIFFDQNTSTPSNEIPYVKGPQLGLFFEADDIDALLLFDNGNNIFEPGVDILLFSLRRESPSLIGLGLSPADVMISTGLGSFGRFASAEDIGLLPSDELDSLELLYCNDIMVCINDHAIFPEPASCVLLLSAVLPLLRRRARR